MEEVRGEDFNVVCKRDCNSGVTQQISENKSKYRLISRISILVFACIFISFNVC